MVAAGDDQMRAGVTSGSKMKIELSHKKIDDLEQAKANMSGGSGTAKSLANTEGTSWTQMPVFKCVGSTGWQSIKTEKTPEGFFRLVDDDDWDETTLENRQTVYWRFGGKLTFFELGFKMHYRMVTHPTLASFFPKSMDIEAITVKNAQFMCSYFGGPRWKFAAIRESHAYLAIKDHHYDAFMDIARHVMTDILADAQMKKKVLDGLEELRRQIVYVGASPNGNSERIAAFFEGLEGKKRSSSVRTKKVKSSTPRASIGTPSAAGEAVKPSSDAAKVCPVTRKAGASCALATQSSTASKVDVVAAEVLCTEQAKSEVIDSVEFPPLLPDDVPPLAPPSSRFVVLVGGSRTQRLV